MAPPSSTGWTADGDSDDESIVSSIYDWIPHPIYPVCIRSRWAIFVVAKILVRHYPLAVICTPRPGRASVAPLSYATDGSFFGSLSRIITTLSDDTNRGALEAEQDLAHEYYSSGRADTLLPSLSIPLHSDGYPKLEKERNTDASQKGYYFPFLVTCLLSGAHQDLTWAQDLSCWDVLPLATVYDDLNLEAGAIFLDITDLSDIGYGVVSSMIENFAWLPTNKDPFTSTKLGSNVLMAARQQRVENNHSRRPLSMKEYQEKFQIEDDSSDGELDKPTVAHIEAMHTYRVVDAAVVDGEYLRIAAASQPRYFVFNTLLIIYLYPVVWPPTERTTASIKTISTVEPLSSQCLFALVDGADHLDELDFSVFNDSKDMRSFSNNCNKH